MNSYKIKVEIMESYDDAKRIKAALEALGQEVRVSCNVKKREIEIDSNQSVEDICAVLEEEGFELEEMEMM